MKNLKAAQWRSYAPIDLKIARRFSLPYKFSCKFNYQEEKAREQFLSSDEGKAVIEKIKLAFTYWLSNDCKIEDGEVLKYLRHQANYYYASIQQRYEGFKHWFSEEANEQYEAVGLERTRSILKAEMESNFADKYLFEFVCRWRLDETMREPKNCHQKHGHDNGKYVNKGSGYGGINSVRIPSKKRPLSTWRNFYDLFGRWFEPSENDYKVPVRKI